MPVKNINMQLDSGLSFPCLEDSESAFDPYHDIRHPDFSRIPKDTYHTDLKRRESEHSRRAMESIAPLEKNSNSDFSALSWPAIGSMNSLQQFRDWRSKSVHYFTVPQCTVWGPWQTHLFGNQRRLHALSAEPFALPFVALTIPLAEPSTRFNLASLYQFLDYHNASLDTYQTPPGTVQTLAEEEAWFVSAKNVRGGWHPGWRLQSDVTTPTASYVYEFDQQRFNTGPTLRFDAWHEEHFYARWEPALREGKMTRDDMILEVSQTVNQKASLTARKAWRDYVLDDARLVMFDVREHFQAAAIAVDRQRALGCGGPANEALATMVLNMKTFGLRWED